MAEDIPLLFSKQLGLSDREITILRTGWLQAIACDVSLKGRLPLALAVMLSTHYLDRKRSTARHLCAWPGTETLASVAAVNATPICISSAHHGCGQTGSWATQFRTLTPLSLT